MEKSIMIKKILVLLTLTLFIHGYSHADDHMTPNSFAVTLKVPEVDVAKVEALLQSHHQFMHDKHSLSGENRLNSYSIVKGYEVVDMTDPSKGLTGNVFYFLSEHYETPMGLQMHGEAGENWKDLSELQAIMYKYQVAVAFPGEVIAKMNR
jgi:hypothetical protein